MKNSCEHYTDLFFKVNYWDMCDNPANPKQAYHRLDILE